MVSGEPWRDSANTFACIHRPLDSPPTQAAAQHWSELSELYSRPWVCTSFLWNSRGNPVLGLHGGFQDSWQRFRTWGFCGLRCIFPNLKVQLSPLFLWSQFAEDSNGYKASLSKVVEFSGPSHSWMPFKTSFLNVPGPSSHVNTALLNCWTLHRLLFHIT